MGDGHNGGQTYNGGSGPDRKANLVNLRDTQPGKIQAKVNEAGFAHWRHCVEMFVDSANQWKGGSLILERLRVEKTDISPTCFDTIVSEILQKDDDHLLEDTDWNFSEKTREFYTFLLPRLNGALLTG